MVCLAGLSASMRITLVANHPYPTSGLPDPEVQPSNEDNQV